MNYSTFTLKQLKEYTQENNIFVTGDKRTKQAYIDSIEHHLLHTVETEEIASTSEATKTVFVQAEAFTVEQPAPKKLSSAVCLQPFAFVLAAIILGVIWLVTGFGIMTTRFIYWLIPYAQNTWGGLQKKLSDRKNENSLTESTPIPI